MKHVYTQDVVVNELETNMSCTTNYDSAPFENIKAPDRRIAL